MGDVVLVSGVRSAIGTFGGTLKDMPASPLAAAEAGGPDSGAVLERQPVARRLEAVPVLDFRQRRHRFQLPLRQSARAFRDFGQSSQAPRCLAALA